jgi:hypothetical protein
VASAVSRTKIGVAHKVNSSPTPEPCPFPRNPKRGFARSYSSIQSNLYDRIDFLSDLNV